MLRPNIIGAFSFVCNGTGQITCSTNPILKFQNSSRASIEMIVKLPPYDCNKVIDFGVIGVPATFSLRQSVSNRNDLIFSFNIARTNDYTISGIATDMYDNWTHLIITYDDSVKILKIYKNGTLFVSINVTGSISTVWTINYFAYSTIYSSLKNSESIKLSLIRTFDEAIDSYVTQIYNTSIVGLPSYINSSSFYYYTYDANIVSYSSMTCQAIPCFGPYLYDTSGSNITNNAVVGCILSGIRTTIDTGYESFCKDSYYCDKKMEKKINSGVSGNLLSPKYYLSFSSTNALNITTGSVAMQPSTISVWLRLYSKPTTQTALISFVPTNSNVGTTGAVLSIINDDISFLLAGSEKLASDRIGFLARHDEFKFGEWMLFTIVMGSSSIHLYINDIPITMNTNGLIGQLQTIRSVIGSVSGQSSYAGFNGDVGPVYYAPTVYRTSRIYDNYYPDSINCQIYYPMLDGNSNTLTNSGYGGSANNGSIGGTANWILSN